MKKHTSEDAFYERMRNLADVNKSSVNESKNRTLGTLIDFERATDGVAYGIVKEQHKYYIKKGGLNENLNVADFVYIGGVQNVTDYQYIKLAEAKKQRNFLLATVNEGIATKVNPNGSKKVVLTEDKAGQEIAMAASKVDDLEDATAAAEVPAEPIPEPAMDVPADDGAAEMDAGLDAIDAPADGGEMPVDDMGADPLAGGGEEMPVDGALDGAVDGAGMPVDGEEMPVDGEEMPADGAEGADEATREIEKTLGKLTNTLRKTELTEPQVKSYVNSFLSAFKDDFPEIDIEDRKEMAEKITKVVPDSDIEDLGQSVEDEEAMEDPLAAAAEAEPEAELAEEEQCAECGGFAQYAEARGYSADSIRECGEEEMTNLVSGYANAHGEGQNDGDFKAVALFITPEILQKLKGDYGHDDFANQVEPFSNEMNETSAEDKDAQINELFGNLGSMMRGAAGKVAGDVAGGVKKAGQNIANKAGQVSQAVGNYATGVKQAAHGAVVPAEVKKLEGIAANLGKQIDALNKRMTKAGKEPVNVRSILSTIANQVAGAGRSANLGGIAEGYADVDPQIMDAWRNAAMQALQSTGVPEDQILQWIEAKEIPQEIMVGGSFRDALNKLQNPTPELLELIRNNFTQQMNEEGLPVDSTEVMPPAMEEEVDIKVSEKAGKKLSADNTPEVEMKEGEEPEGEVIDDVEDAIEDGGGEEGGEENVLDLTKHQEPEMPMISGVDSMGGGVVKPEGAEVTTVEVTKDSVSVTMNESETKLRTYIRNRLQEHAGIKKPSLNESKKSKGLQKLDRVIDKQFNLFESEAKKKVDESINEILGMSVGEKLAKINPQDPAAIEALFQQAFQNILINPKMGAIGRVAKTTAPEVKLDMLQQYVDGRGGSLRLADQNTLRFVPKAEKDAATHSRFRHGGTQGKTQLGGV